MLVLVVNVAVSMASWGVRLFMLFIVTPFSQVGGREDSSVYIRMKIKAGEEVR